VGFRHIQRGEGNNEIRLSNVKQLLCLDEAHVTVCTVPARGGVQSNPAHYRADRGNPAPCWLIGGHWLSLVSKFANASLVNVSDIILNEVTWSNSRSS